MRTLTVNARLGESIVGTAALGHRFHAVQVGRMAPLVRTSEDAKGLLRAGFLDASVPAEVSLLAAKDVRSTLVRSAQPLFDTPVLTDAELLRDRPIVVSVPAECVCDPTEKAAAALRATGPIGTRVAALRGEEPDVRFWSRLSTEVGYRKWAYELAAVAGTIRASLIAPPVPVVSRDQPESATAQMDANAAFARIITADPTLRSLGPLYSLHVHPGAFRNADSLRRALRALDMVLALGDIPYWGVHVDLTDISVVGNGGADEVKLAREFLRDAARIASGAGLFSWITNAGPIGPALLDEGMAFTGYTPGMTPRRAYLDGFQGRSEDTLFGKVLGGVWDYNLHPRRAVASRGWKLEETDGRFPHVVPGHLRDNALHYRIEFAKPYNCAVAERHNELREREISVKGEPAPGRSVLGRSEDRLIAPWGR